jgi:hypothetical protein
VYGATSTDDPDGTVRPIDVPRAGIHKVVVAAARRNRRAFEACGPVDGVGPVDAMSRRLVARNHHHARFHQLVEKRSDVGFELLSRDASDLR